MITDMLKPRERESESYIEVCGFFMSRYRLFTPFFVGARGGVYVHGQYVCVQDVCGYSECVCVQ